jgi:hypothetical protein
MFKGNNSFLEKLEERMRMFREAGTIRRQGDHEPPEPLTQWLEMPVFLEWPEKDSENLPPLERLSRLLAGLIGLLSWVFCSRS